MRSKVNDLFIQSSSTNFNVIILTETWLNSNFLNDEILNKDWIIYRKDRDFEATNTSRGGGVLIAIKKDLPSELVEAKSIGSTDFIFIKIKLKEKDIFLGGVYIPPSSNEETYNSYLDDFLKYSSDLKENDDCLLFGDFNRPDLEFIQDCDNPKHLLPINITTPIDLNIVDTFYSSNLVQVNNIFNDFNKTLDLCFLNLEDDFVIREPFNAEHLFKNSQHHKALVLEYKCNDKNCSVLRNKFLTYNFNAANYTNINNFLCSVDWESLCSEDDVNIITDKFYEKCYDAIDKFVPKKLITINPEPWLDRGLRNLRNRKNRAFNYLNKFNDQKSREEYETLANSFNELSIKAYEEYTKKIGEDILSNPKKFFDFVNVKRKCNGYPSTMKLNNQSAQKPKDIANLFKDNFEKIYTPTDNTQVDETIFDYISSPSSVINDVLITEEELIDELLSLQHDKGAGPDGIPNIFLTNCALHLCKPLLSIFNKSLKSGVFPTFWKSSYLTPIFKNGNRNDIVNYRGIAILSALAKLLEKIVCKKLTSFVITKLNDQQHGFVKNRSTVSNLSVFTNFIFLNLETGHQVDAIYTDFSKAFDRVDHRILFFKLKRFGFDGNILNWLKSYLSDRTQKVRIAGEFSDDIQVTSGVPQGSHLGPLLFNIFICDLSVVLSKVNHLFYADDLKLYRAIKTSDDVKTLQEEIDKLESWCTINKLYLNADKCNIMTFSRKKNFECYTYLLKNSPLNRTHNIKDLGVLLDSQLNFRPHYDSIIAKSLKMLGFIKRRASEFKNLWVTKTLFCSLVRSNLEYACVIWSPYHQVHSNALESIQKKFLLFALRQIHDPRDYENLPSYSNRLKTLNMQRLSDRRELLSACFIFDILHENIKVPYFSDKVTRNNDVRQTRHTRYLKESRHRTDYGKYEPINRSIINFNKLIQFYDSNITKQTFKQRVIKFYSTNLY